MHGHCPGASQATFAERLNEIMARPEYAHAVFGVALYDLAERRIVYGLLNRWLFAPGSTTKLLTVGTALATLGPGYRFRTPIHRTGPLHDGTIDGDLVLVASGDLDLPGRVGHGDTLTFANYDHSYGAGDSAAAAVPGDPLAVIRELATQVAMSGVSRVHGHVLVDATLLSSRGLGERPTDDRSPIVVNDNVIDVTVRPGDREDKPPSVMISPDLGYLVLVIGNETHTGAPGTGPTIALGGDSADATGRHHVHVAGTLPAGGPAILYAYSVSSSGAFCRACADWSLSVTEASRIDEPPLKETPDFSRLAALYNPTNRVAEHVSPPFAEEAKVTLKVSQNLHASMMPCPIGVLAGRKDAPNALGAGFSTEL